MRRRVDGRRRMGAVILAFLAGGGVCGGPVAAGASAQEVPTPRTSRPAPAFRVRDARDHVEDLTWTLFQEHLLLAELGRQQWENRCARSLARLLDQEPRWRAAAGLPERLPRWGWTRLVRRLLHPSRKLTMAQMSRRRDLMAQAVLEALGDPHTHLQDLDDNTALAVWFSLTSGLSAGQDADGLYLDLVMVGSDGHRKGLRAGDRLLAVNQVPATELTLRRAQRWIEEGCTVEIQRPGWKRSIELVIHQMNISSLTPTSDLIAGDVGYLRYPIFNGNAMQVQQAIRRLDREGARAWILDLRGNPGGLLYDGQTLADLFLQPGQPISWITERRVPEEWDEPDAFESDPQGAAGTPDEPDDEDQLPDLVGRGPAPDGPPVATGPPESPYHRYWMTAASQPVIPWDEPLVVLVDGSTASAAELVAIALQAHRRALIVGRPSYGKGVGQSATVVFHHREATGEAPPQEPPTGDPESQPGEREKTRPSTDWIYQPLWLTTFRFESPRRQPDTPPGVQPDLRVAQPDEPPELVELLARIWDDSHLLAALSEDSPSLARLVLDPAQPLPEVLRALLQAHGLAEDAPQLVQALSRVWQVGRPDLDDPAARSEHGDPDVHKALRVIQVQRRGR